MHLGKVDHLYILVLQKDHIQMGYALYVKGYATCAILIKYDIKIVHLLYPHSVYFQ